MTDPAADSPTGEPFPWGRAASAAGMGMLCVSVFLPQTINITGEIVPVEAFAAGSYGLLAMGTVLLPFLAAIVLLPICICRAVPRLTRSSAAERFLSVTVCVVCLMVLTVGFLEMAAFLVATWPGSDLDLLIAFLPMGVTGAAAVLAGVAAARCRLPRKAAAGVAALGASCLAYFAFWPLAGAETLPGLWLSIAACVPILAGGLGEYARAGDEGRSGAGRKPLPPGGDRQ